MKLNKMMFAALMIGAVMVACEKKPEPTPVPVTPGGEDTTEVPVEVEYPEVAAPEAGYATIVINIPAGSECNGIAFKGTLDGAAWSGANTYVGLDDANASPENCIKFAPIADAENWYQATYKMGEVGLKGKICLIFTDDNNWQGQAVDWEIVEDYTTAEYTISSDGNIEIPAAGGLVYVMIPEWNKSECVEEVLISRKITVKVPKCDAAEAPVVIGSFVDWSLEKAVAMTLEEGSDDTYTATVEAYASDQFKFAGAESGWGNEIQKHTVNAEEDVDKWDGLDNIKFGNDTEFNLDYSGEEYSWKKCVEEPAPAE